MESIILAAGKSKRFGTNKLLVNFAGKNLVEWNLEFCRMNSIRKVIVVINRNDINFEEFGKLEHPIITSLRNLNYKNECCNLIQFVFQDSDEYGPGAGIKAAAPYVTDDFCVLYGDNFLHGIFDKDFKDRDAKITYMFREHSEENLRLSVFQSTIGDKFIVREKPHTECTGKFHCGFSMYKKHTINNIFDIKPSERGEYEITDFMNTIENKEAMKLDVAWTDVTYASDTTFVEKYILQQITKTL